MLNWAVALRRLFGKSGPRIVEDANATKLRAMLGRCPACSADLDGHAFTLFASAVARKSDVPRLTEFINEAKAQHWISLRQFREWDGVSNNLEAFIIRCSSGGVLVIVRSPFELWENDEIVMVERIAIGPLSEACMLIQPTEWHPFGTVQRSTPG